MRLAKTNRLKALLPDYQRRDFNYAEVGATAGDLPAGYRHTRLRRAVGTGEEAFQRAAEIVTTWAMHRGAGLKVEAPGPATAGQTVVLAIGLVIGLVVPCRVVYQVDEPGRRGFAYGTLPDHPEAGEESFVVSLGSDQQVWLELTAFARPAPRLLRWAGPIVQLLDEAVLRSYVRSVRRQIGN